MKEVAGITFTQTIKLRFEGSWEALPGKSAWYLRIEENYNVRAAGRLASMTLARGGEVRMAEYIDREKAIALIEEKQKELCPVGRYGRNYVYGSDREKYDSWDEIIDKLENIETEDVAPVVHGVPVRKNRESREVIYLKAGEENGEILYKRYVYVDKTDWVEYCPSCGKRLCSRFNNYCPNCGAKMDL